MELKGEEWPRDIYPIVAKPFPQLTTEEQEQRLKNSGRARLLETQQTSPDPGAHPSELATENASPCTLRDLVNAKLEEVKRRRLAVAA